MNVGRMVALGPQGQSSAQARAGVAGWTCLPMGTGAGTRCGDSAYCAQPGSGSVHQEKAPWPASGAGVAVCTVGRHVSVCCGLCVFLTLKWMMSVRVTFIQACACLYPWNLLRTFVSKLGNVCRF